MPRKEGRPRRERYAGPVNHSEVAPRIAGPLDGRRAVALDAVIALAYVAFAVVLASARHPAHALPTRLGPWEDGALLAAVGLPVAGRRLWPVAALTVAVVASIGALALGMLHDPMLASALCLYTVATRRPRRRWLPAGAVAIVGVAAVVATALAGTSPTGRGAWLGTGLLGIALLAGSWLLGRAARTRDLEIERAMADRARQAVAQERLRVARELHDIVAHSMSLIAVKAGVARHVARERPGEAGDALAVIEQTSRGALADMRSMLDALRDGRGDAEPATPTPGVADLADLVRHVGTAGVQIDLCVRGVDGLPSGVGLAVYRIVQEALTNVLKHVGPTDCRVVVAANGDRVLVHVTDSGPGQAGQARRAAVPGRGLVGMRERAVLYGGELIARQRPEGGFEVRAILPHGERRPDDA